MQKGNAGEGQRDGNGGDKGARIKMHEREGRLQDRGQTLFADPAQRKARHGHAQLRRGKIRIEMRPDVLDKTGPEIPLLHQRVELAAAHFHDSKFASNKERIQPDQRDDCCQFKEQHAGRIPLRRDYVSSQWRRSDKCE